MPTRVLFAGRTLMLSLLLAVPLYLAAHIQPMMKALSLKGDTEATTRRHASPPAPPPPPLTQTLNFAPDAVVRGDHRWHGPPSDHHHYPFLPSAQLQTASLPRRMAILSAWLAIGRSGEIAATPWEGLEWDPEHQAVFTEIRQSKTSKVKMISYTCGSERHNCWFLALADYLVLHAPPMWGAHKDAWVIPELHAHNAPGSAMGLYIKALRVRDRGGAAAYSDYAVPSLPDRVSAGGLRPGGCNTLAKYMPAEFIAHSSGHDLKQVGSLYDYIDANRAIAVVGGFILAGWPPCPWGRLCEGPKPASLKALVDTGVDQDDLDHFIDAMFNLDSCSPPMLLCGGSNRPMVEAAFASMIMYHDQRKMAGEVRTVLVKLENMLTADKLHSWGATIRTKFDADNIHLKMGCSTSDTAVATVISALGRSLSESKSETRNLQREISMLSDLLQGVSLSSSQPAAQPMSPGGTPAPASPSPMVSASVPRRTPPVTSPPQSMPPSSMGPLLPHNATGSEPRPNLIGLGADLGDVYASLMARGGVVPSTLASGDRGRCKLLLQWCNAMATSDEKKLLLPAKVS